MASAHAHTINNVQCFEWCHQNHCFSHDRDREGLSSGDTSGHTHGWGWRVHGISLSHSFTSGQWVAALTEVRLGEAVCPSPQAPQEHPPGSHPRRSASWPQAQAPVSLWSLAVCRVCPLERGSCSAGRLALNSQFFYLAHRLGTSSVHFLLLANCKEWCP